MARDLTGVQFGRWTVVDRAPNRINKSHWNCVCVCGAARVVAEGNLLNGKTKSCRCLSRELNAARMTKHGMTESREYCAWCHMKARCLNANDSQFHNYGGRGISICDRWMNGFENFLADMGPCPPGLELERKNNNGNYEPSNCKWATEAEQSRNQRRNRYITFRDRTMVLSDWAKEFEASPAYLCGELRQGRTMEQFANRRRRKAA